MASLEAPRALPGDWHTRYVERFYRNKPGWKHHGELWRELLDRFIPQGCRVLEIGGGPGRSGTKEFRQRECRVVGLDVDPVIRNNPHLHEAHVYPGGPFPLPDNAFDVAVAHWVVEHVPDPEVFFREVARVLAPNGVFLFRTPNVFHYKTVAARVIPHGVAIKLVRWLRRDPEEAHDPYPSYYGANSRRRIRRLLSASGLDAEVLGISEGLPLYGKRSRIVFLLSLAYERLVNSTRALEGVRHTIDCVARKPATP